MLNPILIVFVCVRAGSCPTKTWRRRIGSGLALRQYGLRRHFALRWNCRRRRSHRLLLLCLQWNSRWRIVLWRDYSGLLLTALLHRRIRRCRPCRFQGLSARVLCLGQRRIQVLAGNACCRQTLFLLELPNRLFGLWTIVPVLRHGLTIGTTGIHLLQAILQELDLLPSVAEAQPFHLMR